MDKLNLVDFFCGCGGTSLGFQNAGWNIAMGIDFDKKASKSYKENFPNASFINKDIKDISVNHFIKQLNESLPNYKNKNQKIGFSLCAPCQPFSSQNKNRLDKSDNRLNLLDETIKFIDKLNPNFIFLENVPGITITQKNSSFQKFINHITNKNYKYNFDIVTASQYGIPQNRKRLILIASKQSENIKFPNPTHNEKGTDGLKPFVTVGETIKKLNGKKIPKLNAGEKHKKIANHEVRNLSDLNIERMEATPKNGGSRKSWPKKLWLECHKNNTGFGDVYGRMSWDKPAPTLTTNCTNITNGRFGHPTQTRGISILEAMLLQTFPADYELIGSLGDKSKQVGNAVPPLLAEVFAKHIRNELLPLNKKFHETNQS